MSQNSYLYAFCVVFLAGIFWSFGALTVKAPKLQKIPARNTTENAYRYEFCFI